MTSCNWSDRCFFDFNSNWFQPRPGLTYLVNNNSGGGAGAGSTGSPTTMMGSMEDMAAAANATALVAKDLIKTTANALVGAAAEQAAHVRAEWTGVGMEWLRSLLGKREWRIDCLDLYIRL